MKSFLCMRGKNLPMILFLILLLALSIPMVSVAKASPDGTVVYVEPPTDDPEIGDTFPVNVSIFNCSTTYGQGLWSFEFKLWYNTTILNAIDVVAGPAITGQGSWFQAIKQIDNTIGMVWYGGTFTGLPLLDIPGNETLTTITFTALEAGTTTLHLNETLVGTAGGAPVAHTTTDADVTVVGPPDTPPVITVLSPENRTYKTSSVPLTFTVSEPTSWIGYSRDGQANVTITGNTTLSSLSEGTHSIIIYANDTAGNMGSSNTIYFTIDITPPTIETPTRVPTGDIMPDQPVKVSVNVTDMESGVKNVTLSYTTNNGTSWTNLTMNFNSTTSLYETAIPGQSLGTWVKYKIIAYDQAGNPAVNDNEGEYHLYIVIPEFPSAIILPLFIFFALIAVALAKKIRRKVIAKTT